MNNKVPSYKEALLDFVILPTPDSGAFEGRDDTYKDFMHQIEDRWYLELWIKSCSECTDGD